MRTIDFDDPTGAPRPLGALPFYVAYVIPTSALAAVAWGGLWSWSTAVLIFVITPGLDIVLGHNRRNPAYEEPGPPARRDLVFDLALWLWVPTQVAIVTWAIVKVSSAPMPAPDLIGLVISVGLSSGAGGINVAHELMHRGGRIERALGEILMTAAVYPHFCIEHILGHHRNVATPGDPASAHFGESVFRFLPRTLWGSLVSAWRIETDRVRRSGRGLLFLADRRLRYPFVLAAVFAGLVAVAGWRGAAFWVLQGLVAILLLEVINYIEHYGLERRRLESGRWEPVGPQHSWNASQRLTNCYLFNLQRHADHHEHASRPYWLLRHVPDSPQLPAGYATMCLTALVPPVWRRIMDPRVMRLRGAMGEGARQLSATPSPPTPLREGRGEIL